MNPDNKNGSTFPVKIIVLLFVILCGVLSVLAMRSFWGGIKQPIAFNHKIHAENGLVCLDCHIYYETQEFSGRPTIDICSGCHEEPQGEGHEEAKIVEFVQSGKEVDWKRLYRVPEDVTFSHRLHVVVGELECTACHGQIGETTKPPGKPVKIKMKKCMKCHEARNVDNDCIACHR